MVDIPASAPRGPGVLSGLGVVAFYFALQLATGTLAVTLLAFGYGAMHGLRHRLSRDVVARLLGSPDIRAALTILTLVVAAALTLWLVHRCWPQRWSEPDPPGLGFTLPGSRRWFPVAVVAGVVMVFLGGVVTQWLAHGHQVQQDVSMLGHETSLGLRLALAVMVVGVAPLVEELLFRGVLLSGLMRRMPVSVAVLVSALVFGCAHVPDFGFAWYAVPALVGLGVVLALLRLGSRSLWPAVVAHAGNNLVAAVTWFMVVHPHG